MTHSPPTLVVVVHIIKREQQIDLRILKGDRIGTPLSLGKQDTRRVYIVDESVPWDVRSTKTNGPLSGAL